MTPEKVEVKPDRTKDPEVPCCISFERTRFDPFQSALPHFMGTDMSGG